MRCLQQQGNEVVRVLALILLVMASLAVLGASETAPSCTIFVQPGESIQAAIDKATEGAVICLGEGTWQENIKITKSLTLQGAGADKTLISGAEECYPVIWVASREEGAEIEVHISEISATDAYGYWCVDESPSGDGLFVEGKANVAINSCEIAQNEGSGIQLGDLAQVYINNSVISENGIHGVYVMASASVAIGDSEILGNTYSGVYTEDSAFATVRNTRISRNEDAGIWSISNQAVQGSDNDISDNGIALVGNVLGSVRCPLCKAQEMQIIYPNDNYDSLQQALDALLPGGILILQDGEYVAGLTVSKEVQMEAAQGASVLLLGVSEYVPVISLVGGAKVNIDGITITEGYDGIYVSADAQIIATNCTISRNDNNGVTFSGSAQGDLVECAISSNWNHGVDLKSSAEATISACSISDNYEAGVHASDTAQSTVQDSTISRNYYGIHLESSCQVALDENTIIDNEYGIASFAGQQAALGRGNHLWGNGTDLVGDASPVLLLSGVEPTEIEIVYPDPSYKTLQQVIDALLPGGRLILRAGKYEAGVIVYRNLFVESEDGAEIVLTAKNGETPVFLLIDGSNLQLSGITITGGKDGLRAIGNSQAQLTDCTIVRNRDKGIDLSDSAKATITNCVVSENEVGINLSGSAKATITDCTVTYNAEVGLASSSDQVVEGSGNRVFANGIDLEGNLTDTLRVSTPEEEMNIFYPSPHYDTLQEAIDALPPGGTLILKEGKYDVAVTISKEIEIRSQPGREVVLRGAVEGQPTLLLTEGANLDLSGVTITGGEDGLRMEGDAQAGVTNCTITKNGDAIELLDSSQVVITACTVSENDCGIVLRNHARVEISDSLITANADDGIWLFDSSQATVTDCTISDHQYECQGTTFWDLLLCYFHFLSGIHLQDTSEATIAGCTISGNDAGIALDGSARATVQACTVTENNKTGGLYLEGSAQADITRCTISENKYGVYLYGPGQVEVSSCTLSGNEDSGVYLGSSAHATILDCSISDNDGPGIALKGSAAATITMDSITENEDGVSLEASAQLALEKNVIADNTGAGIISSSDQPVEGSGNRFSGNGVDLQGNIAGQVRLPLYEPAQTEIVYPSEPYESLQGAIDALLPGGRLVLQEGEYKGGLTILKEVQIEAQEGAEVVIRGVNEKAPVFSLIPGANLRLFGLTVTGGEDGIIAAADTQLEIEKCVVTGNSDDGIELAGTARATLAQCRIGANNDKGIQLRNSAQAEITRCTSTENSDGLYLSGSAQANISFCTLSGNEQHGVYLESSTQAVIINCIIIGNGNGISLYGSAQATLQANTITNNAGAGITSSSDQTIEGGGNYLYGNGVDLQGSIKGEIRLLLRESTQTKIVYPNEAYKKLQEAIDALLPGGRLILKEGEYEEQLTISKEVQIEAQEGAEVVLQGVSDTVPVISLIPGANLDLYGITVTGGEYGLYAASDAQAMLDHCTITENSSDGIVALDTAQVIIVDCTVTANGGTGIDSSDSTEVTITETTVRENTDGGIDFSGSAIATIANCTITANGGTGIDSSDSTEVTITGATVEENADGGIDLFGSAIAAIANCTITTNGDAGISLDDSAHATVTECTVLKNHGDGATLSDSSSVKIIGSTVSNNLLSGIYLEDDSHADMIGCEVSLNVHGLELANTAQIMIDNTSIFENRYSAFDLSDSSQVTIMNSSLYGNTLGLRLRGSTQADITGCQLFANTTGMLLLESSKAKSTECAFQDNIYDGISLWNNSEISTNSCHFSNNGRFNIDVGPDPYTTSIEEPFNGQITGNGVSVSYPQQPPAAVLRTKDSVVHVDVMGTDPNTGKDLWVDANGVVVGPSRILTCRHLFEGENDPNVLLNVYKLTVDDPDAYANPDDYTAFMKLKDLSDMIMDNRNDLATLFTDRDLPQAPLLAEVVPPPHDIVWFVGCLDGVWYIIPGVITFPERSCILDFFQYVSRDGVIEALGNRYYLPDMYANINENTEHGLSGGPVVTPNGELVGILGPEPCIREDAIGVWLATKAAQHEATSDQ